MRVAIVLALCLASVMSAPTFKNAAACGPVASNGRCGTAGVGGTRCAWGYCSQWSWCGTGAAYKARGCQPAHHAMSGCHPQSYWNVQKQKYGAAQALKAKKAQEVALKKAQEEAAKKAAAAAAAKKAKDAAAAKAAAKAKAEAEKKAKAAAAALAAKKAHEAALRKIAEAKAAALAKEKAAQKKAAEAAAKAAAAAKKKEDAAKAAKAAAAKVAKASAVKVASDMAASIRKDEKQYEKQPAFKNPSTCGNVGIASNGRCGNAGKSHGGPKCQWGNCSQWEWCGVGAAYNGPHKEWYHTSGCASKAYWAGKLKAWKSKNHLYNQWISGFKSGLKSLNANKKYKLTIENQTNKNMDVYWVDYHGNQKKYVSLKDNQKWAVNTYDTHPWVFKGAYGTVLGMWQGNKANANTNIEIQPDKVVQK